MRPYYFFKIEDMVEIDRIIFDETSRGIVKEESCAFMRRLVGDLASGGAQGIVLACTELFLLVEEGGFPGVQVFDTTKLHVEEIVKVALNGME